MIRKLIPYAALTAVCCLAACDNQLKVTNPVAGETQRVLGTPDDAETLLGSYYKRWHAALYGTDNPPTNFEGMANVMSMMNYSSLANNCQNARLPFAGATNANAPGNVCRGEQSNPYFTLSEVQRVASNFLTSVDAGLELQSEARAARDRSYAEFLRGMALGYLAMFYDSAAVISPKMDMAPENCKPDPFTAVCVGALRSYTVVMDSMYAAFARAITFATTSATGAKGFPLPADWIPSPTSFTAPEFVKLIRSYRARFRASVARTPAERAAVSWPDVIADATNGLSEDHYNITSTTNGPGGGWRRIYDGGSTWHQMPPFIIGMADTSGSYAAWIAQPVGERGSGNTSFFMVTPDTRFPQGLTRAAQQTDFAIAQCADASTVCKRYFANRPAGSDQFSGAGWGFSNYDFNRFHSWVNRGDGTARNGKLLFFAKVEVDMLAAEGYIRTGNFASAATLINASRTAHGLPAMTQINGTSPVPGGNACVPKVPVAPFNVVACGNMMEAMKWEKRMETAYVHFASWFLDSRGWGDLAADTPLFWAVPYQDLQARGYALSAIYGTGLGNGNAPGSFAPAKGTYGW